MKLGLNLASVADRLMFHVAGGGWPSVIGVVVLLGAVGVEVVGVPQQRAIAAGNRQAAEAAHQDYLRAAGEMRKGQPNSTDTLASFRARLTSDQEADAVFETIQADAQKNGLAPAGTEYKWQSQKGAGLSEVRIVMPLKAGYAPLRAFVKDVTTDVPGLALDQFDVKRENIGASVVEARLSFSLYLKAGK